MVAHILASSGLRVFLGGNVRGVSNLPLLKALEEGDYLILKLDSWQLQGFKSRNQSTHFCLHKFLG